MLPRCASAALVLAAALLAAPPAAAQSQPEVFGPYAGEIPFRCELQNVGTGTDYPDPDADPFCVEFDKTNQNVTDFGIAEFTAQEPARVAAASGKCFYFQRDHWTGSVVQGSGPETWHWDGDYWFDRARGVGGASVKDFRVGGQPQDASPYAPEAYRPYFDEGGGGGVLVRMESGPDPSCAAKVDTPQERDEIYANRSFYPDCIEPGGGVRGRRVGGVRLGLTREALRSRLGPPIYARGHLDAWCLIGKGELRAAYGDRGRAQMVVTSGSGQAVRGVSRGDRRRRAMRRLDLARPRSFKAFGVKAFYARRQLGRRVWVGISHDRVRWLLIAKPRDHLRESTFSNLLRRIP